MILKGDCMCGCPWVCGRLCVSSAQSQLWVLSALLGSWAMSSLFLALFVFHQAVQVLFWFILFFTIFPHFSWALIPLFHSPYTSTLMYLVAWCLSIDAEIWAIWPLLWHFERGKECPVKTPLQQSSPVRGKGNLVYLDPKREIRVVRKMDTHGLSKYHLVPFYSYRPFLS